MRHSVGNDLAQSVETEIASEITKQGQTTPECILKVTGGHSFFIFESVRNVKKRKKYILCSNLSIF